MARLNEANSVSSESIEALKRRFVRQNREIARANSTQSLRIRNLESETSRLLAENIALREQLIKAQVDNERDQQVAEHAENTKKLLADKLKELVDLVGSLGNASLIESSKAPKGVQQLATRSPDQRNWKNTFTLSEVTGNLDGRLPPILEDKKYPRSSIGSNETERATADRASMPESDLGSPPIDHVEEQEYENMTYDISSNLENRRKRRSSSNQSELLIVTEDGYSSGQFKTTSIQVLNDPIQPLRTGAKRKLAIRDEEENTGRVQAPEEDFKFNRRAVTFKSKDENQMKTNWKSIGRKVIDGSPESKPQRSTNREMSKDHGPEISARKALGPKNVNTDPVSSPAKPYKPPTSEEMAAIRKDVANRAAAIKAKEMQSAKERSDNTTIVIKQEPETPAPPDLLSPTDSQPSTFRAVSRDTPPPPDLNPSAVTAEGLAAAARATRRPRGSVNYAEPNLRDKMRRPTKELVDAVTGEGKALRVGGAVKLKGSGSEAGECSAHDKIPSRTVYIKTEKGLSLPSHKRGQSDPSGAKEPTTLLGRAYEAVKAKESEDGSPLNAKSGAAVLDDLPESILTQRRRRTSTIHRELENLTTDRSAAAAAMSALVAAKRKAIDGVDRKASGTLEDAMAHLDIYDFKDTSPSAAGDAVKESTTKQSGRTSSSIATSSRPLVRPTETEDTDLSDTDAVVRRDALSRRDKRRQTITTNAHPTESGLRRDREFANKDKGGRNAKNIAALTLRGEGSDGENCGDAGSIGRRAAGRRRSMML